MNEIINQIDFDEGVVLYDDRTKLYYCGMNTWNKQLRNAKIYHSKKHFLDQVDWLFDPRKKQDSPIDLDLAQLKVLTVKTIAGNKVDLEDYKK